MGTEIKLNDSGIKPVLSLFEKFDEYMSAWNPERELEYGLIRMSVPEFDKRAFREAVVNAICHRDYTILRRTLILIDAVCRTSWQESSIGRRTEENWSGRTNRKRNRSDL